MSSDGRGEKMEDEEEEEGNSITYAVYAQLLTLQTSIVFGKQPPSS